MAHLGETRPDRLVGIEMFNAVLVERDALREKVEQLRREWDADAARANFTIDYLKASLKAATQCSDAAISEITTYIERLWEQRRGRHPVA